MDEKNATVISQENSDRTFDTLKEISPHQFSYIGRTSSVGLETLMKNPDIIACKSILYNVFQFMKGKL